MATLSIMHGYMGAGKTTFARKLAQETRAIMLSSDAWMTHFYGANPPQERFPEYYACIEKMQWEMAATFLSYGVDVILDSGFWTREHRDRARGLASGADAAFVIYHVMAKDQEQKRRVLARTAAGEGGQLLIDENAYDTLKVRFEPLGEDEVAVKIST